MPTTTWEQLPGKLDIRVSLGDDFSLEVTFSFDLTGYTFEGKVIQTGAANTTMTIDTANVAQKKITMKLTDTQINTIGRGGHRYYLKLTTGDVSRRYLAGAFTIEA